LKKFFEDLKVSVHDRDIVLYSWQCFLNIYENIFEIEEFQLELWSPQIFHKLVLAANNDIEAAVSTLFLACSNPILRDFLVENNIIPLISNIIDRNPYSIFLPTFGLMALSNLGLDPKYTKKIISLGIAEKMRKCLRKIPIQSEILEISKFLTVHDYIWVNLNPFFQLLSSPIMEIQTLGLVWMLILVSHEEERNEMRVVDGFSKILLFGWGKKNILNQNLARRCLEIIKNERKTPPSLLELAKFKIQEEESITWEHVALLPADLREKLPGLEYLKKKK